MLQGQFFDPLTFSALLVILRSPILREVALWLRVVDVGKESCRYVLTQMGPGHSIAIVPGGAAEALDACSKECILTLNRRKQFIKMALETGYELIFSYFLKILLCHPSPPPQLGSTCYVCVTLCH